MSTDYAEVWQILSESVDPPDALEEYVARVRRADANLASEVARLASAWDRRDHTCQKDDSCFRCAAQELNNLLRASGLGEDAFVRNSVQVVLGDAVVAQTFAGGFVYSPAGARRREIR